MMPITTSDRAVRILLVEDCRATADGLLAFLAPQEFYVRVARDAAAGFIQAIWFRPSVVLVAMNLAGPVGLRLPSLLRRLLAGDAPLVIAGTGPDGPLARSEARMAGCDHFLPKPFDWDLLARLLTDHTPALA